MVNGLKLVKLLYFKIEFLEKKYKQLSSACQEYS